MTGRVRISKKLIYSIFAISVFLIFAFTCANTKVNAESSKETVVIEVVQRYDYAVEMFNILNQERTDAGQSTLVLNESLTKTAMERAAEIAVYFSHTRANNTSCFTANSLMNGENISANYRTPTSAMEGFMNSDGHKANVLNSSYKSVGIGCVSVDGILFWAQCFSVSSSTSFSNIPTNSTTDMYISVSVDNLNLYFAEGTELNQVMKTTKTLTPRIKNAGWGYATCPIKNTNLVWTSSNTDVCTVNSNGEVTAVGVGTATIKCSLGSCYTEATFTVPEPAALESNHPYDNSMNEKWEISYPNAESIDLKFSSNTEVESNFDYIYIYDENNSLVGTYTGTSLANKTITINGSKAIINLKSDSSVTKYGFAIDKITPNYPELNISSFSASSDNINLGDTIKLTSTADGQNLKYKFAYQLNSQWTIIKDYSTSSECTWKPTETGNFKVRLFVSDGISIEKKDITVVVNDTNPITKFSATRYNSIVNQSITLNISATGNMKYKFAYNKDSESWTVIKDYSTANSVKWTPKYQGIYTVRAFATDGENTYRKDITIKVSNAKFTENFTASKSSISLGESVTLKVTPTDNYAKYTYTYTRTGINWATIKENTESTSITWTPKYKGTYTVTLIASDGTASEKRTYTIVVS